jgi:hypothetical protein
MVSTQILVNTITKMVYNAIEYIRDFIVYICFIQKTTGGKFLHQQIESLMHAY